MSRAFTWLRRRWNAFQTWRARRRAAALNIEADLYRREAEIASINERRFRALAQQSHIDALRRAGL